jgi:hypothetical protein
LVGGLRRQHGSAVNPEGPVSAGLDWTTPNGPCLRSANQNAVRSPHSRGTFHFAFLSLEIEIKTLDEALATSSGPMKQRPEWRLSCLSAAHERGATATTQVNNDAEDPP